MEDERVQKKDGQKRYVVLFTGTSLVQGKAETKIAIQGIGIREQALENTCLWIF